MNDKWKSSATLIGIGISIGAILVVILIFVIEAKPTNMSVGPIVFEIPTVNSTTQNSEPVSLGTVKIPGDSNQGVVIKIKESGFYTFRYLSGSYSTFPRDEIPPDQKTWLTVIHIFKGSKAQWDGESPKHEAVFMSVADTEPARWSSSLEAESAAQGMSRQGYFNEGETLTLIADDGRSFYSDNPGEVILEVLFVPQ